VNSAQADYMQAKSQIVQTQTNISQDSTNVERLQKLNAEKIISDQELENAKLKLNLSKSQLEAAKYSTQASFYRLKSAEASLKQSQQNLNRTSIYASMDGTITKLNIEVGQRVVGTLQMAGTEIMKIADLSNMEVLVDISENEITHIGLGDSATIEIDALEEKRFNGRVTDIAYSATKSGLGTSDQVTSFQVKVRISPQSYQELMQGSIKPAAIPFRPGMSALVDIFTDKAEDVLSVPIHAVTLHREPKPKEAENPWAPPKTEEAPTKPVKKEKRQEIVFVYEGGKVKEFPVKIGIADDVFIEIKEGASLGAKVVTGPHTLLNKELEEGMEVKELEKK
jgi:HlyD family secretion protein